MVGVKAKFLNLNLNLSLKPWILVPGSAMSAAAQIACLVILAILAILALGKRRSRGGKSRYFRVGREQVTLEVKPSPYRSRPLVSPD